MRRLVANLFRDERSATTDESATRSELSRTCEANMLPSATNATSRNQAYNEPSLAHDLASNASTQPSPTPSDELSDDCLDVFYYRAPTPQVSVLERLRRPDTPCTIAQAPDISNFMVPAARDQSAYFTSYWGCSHLIPLKRDHADWLFEHVCSNPQVLSWFPDTEGRTYKQTYDFLAVREYAWRQDRLAGWLVEVAGEPAGHIGCGLMRGSDMQVNFVLAPAFWHHSLATDALGAALEYFRTLDKRFEDVVASAHFDNQAAQKVLLKCGFRLRHTANHPEGDGTKKLFFVLERNDLERRNFHPFVARSSTGELLTSVPWFVER